MKTRPYQSRALAAVAKSWETRKSVCLVCPTGGGKTFMGTRAALDQAGTHGRVLWVAHRRELVKQGVAALQRQDGVTEYDVAPVLSNHSLRLGARIQVGTVQTLLARKMDLKADVLVLDECHHYTAENWRALLDCYPDAKHLGLTATPERSDGKPLGDIFDSLVVGAQYSELIADGHLCDATFYRPPTELQSALAQDPLSAWKNYGEGKQAFIFLSTVALVKEWTEKFNAADVPAEYITGKCSIKNREGALQRFRDGETRALLNVDVLTEGVDVPQAAVCILGRTFASVGAYLQAAGRVLRPHETKDRAIIVDLTGCTLKHGLATEDRVYSLDGAGIRAAGEDGLTVKNCLKCGVVYNTEDIECPACGWKQPPKTRRPPKIFSLELEQVWEGERTDKGAKYREYQRLVKVARSRGFPFEWAQKEYRKLFGEKIVIRDATRQEKRAELARLRVTAQERGFKSGFAAVRYKDIFGEWP